MCIVIDANSLSCVFNEENSRHAEFRPLLDWIVSGNGKIVYGGTTYEDELENASSFLKLFTELSRLNKVIVVDKRSVDKKEAELRPYATNRDFDDPHIVAIIIISGIHLVCTGDKRAIPFITNRIFYVKRKCPKVYSSSKCRKLLCDRNIPKKYLDNHKLNKKDCQRLGL
jgi:hypothetical protein